MESRARNEPAVIAAPARPTTGPRRLKAECTPAAAAPSAARRARRVQPLRPCAPAPAGLIQDMRGARGGRRAGQAAGGKHDSAGKAGRLGPRRCVSPAQRTHRVAIFSARSSSVYVSPGVPSGKLQLYMNPVGLPSTSEYSMRSDAPSASLSSTSSTDSELNG